MGFWELYIFCLFFFITVLPLDKAVGREEIQFTITKALEVMAMGH